MNKETFAGLVVDSTDSLYRVSKSILKNDTDCEDAVSEAITIAFQKLDSLKKDEYAKTWLTRIVINECFRIRKQQKKVVPISDEGESVFNSQEMAGQSYFVGYDSYAELRQVMSQLNEKQRLTIILYYYEGYSIKEIAGIMGINQGTVKSRLGRARKELKQFLAEDGYYV